MENVEIRKKHQEAVKGATSRGMNGSKWQKGVEGITGNKAESRSTHGTY